MGGRCPSAVAYMTITTGVINIVPRRPALASLGSVSKAIPKSVNISPKKVMTKDTPLYVSAIIDRRVASLRSSGSSRFL